MLQWRFASEDVHCRGPLDLAWSIDVRLFPIQFTYLLTTQFCYTNSTCSSKKVELMNYQMLKSPPRPPSMVRRQCQ